ncbi:subfamily B ATP-binding cassette protein MsbA [Geomicrobium halophilum]|uniref:Subfamily B ATP-binding cassette protein MsbA n=1 Tax=Geomicrobium halophilum TaxID=549000 RepID=A0A841PVZ1_9BACL|nr:ABC transporter ATP-binding protein [Geomicrobium halophilum]MBB6450551.1 subfamily B ATP-binding cassette protein MsbA [Geomicrobium halophilum]
MRGNPSLEEKPRKQSVRQMFADLFSRVRPQWRLIIIAMIAVLFVALIEFAIPQFIQFTIDIVIPEQQLDMLGWIFAGVIGGAILLVGFQFTGSYLMAIVGQRALYELRNDLYKHMQHADVSFFDRNRTGDLMSRMTNDVNMLQQLLSSGLLNLLTDIFIFIAISTYMFYVNWQLATLILVTFPLLFYLTRYFGKRIRKAYLKVQGSLADMNNHLQDTFSGVRLVKSFAMEDYEAERFSERNETNRHANIDAAKNFSLFGPMVNFVNYIGMGAVVVFGALQTMEGNMTVGMIATFLVYLRLLQNPIRRVSRLMNTIQQAAAAYDRIMAILETRPAIQDPPSAKTLSIKHGEITFHDVTFAYEETNVLKHIDVRFQGGKTTALVGPSGSGKTTITQLLTRFYDPGEGSITIDGTPIDEVTLSSLRSQIGVVSQDVVLVNGTIRDNIAYGQANACMNEIKTAAQIAHAEGFIKELPDGYDSMVGERGVKLSGGQKQRISIARALLKDPKIILLDEATSALDTEAEKAIQAGLAQLLQDRTALVIAHRLSTIQNADHIIVLDEGRVVEQGTHEELLRFNGRYQHLHRMQYSKQGVFS